MSKVNRNVLPLSRVVGASSGVPGFSRPQQLAGDMLVDGGVADNQGIESLSADPARCNVLLVSDASGQMEQLVRSGVAPLPGRCTGKQHTSGSGSQQAAGFSCGVETPARHLGEDHRFAFRPSLSESQRPSQGYPPGFLGILSRHWSYSHRSGRSSALSSARR